MQTRNNFKGSLILILASLLWGMAFVAQNSAADLIPTFLFNGIRSLIGAFFLLGLLFFYRKRTGMPLFIQGKASKKAAIRGGLLCGSLLAVSINLQQFGLVLYPDGVAGEARASFLTALYVILVPLCAIVIQRKLRWSILASVTLAGGGIYLLCLSGGLRTLYLGDLLVFLCAITFTAHIFSIDRYALPVGGILLSCIQFFVCGILSLLLSLIFEWGQASAQSLLAATPAILYMGIVSSGIAYTLQIVGQRYAEPAIASLSMSLESVFGALGGWVVGNKLSGRELFGCALVFCAIIVAQLPQLIASRQEKKSLTTKAEEIHPRE